MLVECQEAMCQATVQTDVVIGVMAADVAPYGLSVTAAGTQPPFSRAALDAFNLADLHERVLGMR